MDLLSTILLHRAVRKAALTGLVGRPRSSVHPSYGRFTREDVREILRRTWRFARADARDDPHLPDVSRGLRDALILREVEPDYATSLVMHMTGPLALRWGRS